MQHREQFFATYPPGHSNAGQEIVRPAVCECGKPFRQRILSERFLAFFEHANALETTAAEVPGMWVPVHCPTCERLDIRDPTTPRTD